MRSRLGASARHTFSRMSNGHPTKPDDTTAEEPALEFAGTHTDQFDDTYRTRVVTTSENGIGTVDHDECGRARWKWSSESGSGRVESTGTFNLLKALDNDALSLT